MEKVVGNAFGKPSEAGAAVWTRAGLCCKGDKNFLLLQNKVPCKNCWMVLCIEDGKNWERMAV